MKITSFYVLFALTVWFIESAVAVPTYSSSLSCLMGESTIKATDYPSNLGQSDNFFKEIAEQSIKSFIKSQPFDQKGNPFKISVKDGRPSLSGYIVVKESYEQIKLNTAKCSKLMGNITGFEFKCEVNNPVDNQKLYLSYLYKNKIKMGSFSLKISRSKTGLLAKNIFACESF